MAMNEIDQGAGGAGGRASGKATAICLAVCLLVVGAWFAPWWAGGKNLLPMDLAHEMMQPWRGGGPAGVAKNHFVSDGVDVVMGYHLFAAASYRREGRVGWSDLTYGGTAQYANTMALYDDWAMQLHRWFDFRTAWHLGLFGQVLLAAWGMVLLLRERGVTAIWSACGALAYAANSQFATWIYHRFTMGAFCWVPWILWAIVCYRHGRRRAWAAVPVLVALAFLGGTLQHAAMVALAVAAAWGEEAWAVWRARGGGLGQLWLLGRYAAWGLLGCGIAALMLLPCQDALATSLRLGLHTGLFANAEKSMYPEGVLQPWLNLAAYPLQVFPSALGRCDSVDVLKLFKSNLFFVAYFGSLPVLIAYLAAFRKDTGVMERLLILAGLLLPLTPLVRFLYQRLLVLFILGGTIAFAVFMSRAGDATRRRLCQVTGWAAACVTAVWLMASVVLAACGKGVIAALRRKIVTEGAGSSFGGCRQWLEARADHFTTDLFVWSPQQAVPIGLLALGLWGLGWSASRLAGRRCAGSWMLAVAVVLDVTVFAARWVVWTDPARYPVFPETPEVVALREQVGTGGRVTTLIHPTEHMSRTPFVPNTLAVYGIPSICGYDSVVPNGMILPNESPADAARMGRCGVTHLITWPGNPEVPGAWQKIWESPSMALYRNPLAIPRYIGLASAAAADLLLDGGRPAFQTVAETAGMMNRRVLAVPAGVRVVRIAENQASGWQYRVSGEGGGWKDVGRAKDGSMMLTISGGNPAGVGMEMRYDPPLRRLGCMVSLASLGVLALGQWMATRDRRRPRVEPTRC